MVSDAEEAKQIKQQVGDRYSNILFWVQDENTAVPSTTGGSGSYPQLQLLQKTIPDAGVLRFDEKDERSARQIGKLSRSSLSFVNASEAILLHEALGRSAFQRELQKFSLKARRGEHPLAIVMAEEEALKWLQNELADFKKSGLKIVPPVKKSFDHD